MPTIVFHGTADKTVHPQNGDLVLAQSLNSMPRLHKSAKEDTSPGGRRYRATLSLDEDGRSLTEHWEIEGAGHTWCGGDARGSFTDPAGPDAAQETARFFLQHAGPIDL